MISKGHHSVKRSLSSYVLSFALMATGALLAAIAIEIVLVPNDLIDGGIVGIAMIFGKLFGQRLIPVFLVIFNLPFLYLAYKNIGKTFLLNMLIAVLFFSTALIFLHGKMPFTEGSDLEIVIIGGVTLGAGIGLIIRMGGCLDGTEILGIIANNKKGFTVGQVVFAINLIIFTLAGVVFKSWHPPFLSLMTYFIAMKVMDTVIVGLEETKSVNIISTKVREISDVLIHELGLGLTIMYGRGGYSNASQEIIYVVVERLQLAELKEAVYREDPLAFIAIQDLHEVTNGRHHIIKKSKKKIQTSSEAHT